MGLWNGPTTSDTYPSGDKSEDSRLILNYQPLTLSSKTPHLDSPRLARPSHPFRWLTTHPLSNNKYICRHSQSFALGVTSHDNVIIVTCRHSTLTYFVTPGGIAFALKSLLLSFDDDYDSHGSSRWDKEESRGSIRWKLINWNVDQKGFLGKFLGRRKWSIFFLPPSLSFQANFPYRLLIQFATDATWIRDMIHISIFVLYQRPIDNFWNIKRDDGF